MTQRAIKTPLSKTAAEDALSEAFHDVFGSRPTQNQLALIMAQTALETGRWTKIYNYNFGNIKATSVWRGNVTTFPCSEVKDGKETHYPAGDEHCLFRAYPTAALGAVDYLELLDRRTHWREGLMSGDPKVFNNALTTPPAYYTANKQKYGTALNKLYREFGGSPRHPFLGYSMPERDLQHSVFSSYQTRRK